MAAQRPNDLALYLRLLREVWPLWPLIVVLFLLNLLATPIALLLPLALQLVIASVVAPSGGAPEAASGRPVGLPKWSATFGSCCGFCFCSSRPVAKADCFRPRCLFRRAAGFGISREDISTCPAALALLSRYQGSRRFDLPHPLGRRFDPVGDALWGNPLSRRDHDPCGHALRDRSSSLAASLV